MSLYIPLFCSNYIYTIYNKIFYSNLFKKYNSILYINTVKTYDKIPISITEVYFKRSLEDLFFRKKYLNLLSTSCSTTFSHYTRVHVTLYLRGILNLYITVYYFFNLVEPYSHATIRKI